MSATEDWQRLQRIIFTRWVNQKLSRRHLAPLGDVVLELGQGQNLVALIEILSEKTCTAKFITPPKFKVGGDAPTRVLDLMHPLPSLQISRDLFSIALARCTLTTAPSCFWLLTFQAHELENINKALEFVYEAGVSISLKPSADNLLAGDDKAVLGLVWGIMMRFLKFSDDDAALSPKDSLLKWVELHTVGYPHLDIKSFTKSFNDGLALCALLHKFKPNMLQYENLKPSEGTKNLQLAMDVAEKYFGLEQYLKPADIARLDEKSMLVYVSEYYTG